ncbi:carbohydrate ABC transporter permease [Paenibacillus sp. IB182496]|uniref:Carbohydrate ABC transporter permease n=1 Tax=Paenibacillus sabuli TaxID=2772509 RepID=A0A927BNC9_9BACL|nr:carbohydrate ABC transporter permease [Paenibacillus sabuli]MBD2843701.1 carbohydrate ABC transporter permease [Paenibacillus sabuli]
MHSIMTRGERLFQIAAIGFLTVLSAVMLYPFVHMIAVSLDTPVHAIRPGLHLYPLEPTLEAYRQAFRYDGIYYGFTNTIFRTVVGTLLALCIMTMGAYPLSRKYLPHRYPLMMVIVFTMFFSGGLIPSYLLVKSLGLYDSVWVYIIPSLVNTFSFIILRNFFITIPVELEESAKLDGANDIRILYSLVVPLSKPILATVALWTAVYHWNAWFDGLIYIQDQKKIVLQILLRRLVVENLDQELQMAMQQANTQYVVPETMKAAVLMISTLPILIVYPFLQKYFVKGIIVGSLKG